MGTDKMDTDKMDTDKMDSGKMDSGKMDTDKMDTDKMDTNKTNSDNLMDSDNLMENKSTEPVRMLSEDEFREIEKAIKSGVPFLESCSGSIEICGRFLAYKHKFVSKDVSVQNTEQEHVKEQIAEQKQEQVPEREQVIEQVMEQEQSMEQERIIEQKEEQITEQGLEQAQDLECEQVQDLECEQEQAQELEREQKQVLERVTVWEQKEVLDRLAAWEQERALEREQAPERVTEPGNKLDEAYTEEIDVKTVREAVKAKLQASAGDTLDDKINAALSVGAAYAATVGEDHHAVPVWKEIVKLHPRFQSGSADSVDWELIWDKILKSAAEKFVPFEIVETGDEEENKNDSDDTVEETIPMELKADLPTL